MKKYILMWCLASIFFFANAQANRLESYRVISFNGVTRVSFAFTQKPAVNIIKETHSLKITASIPDCVLGDVPRSFTTPDLFARNIQISSVNKGLSIEITTSRTFDQIRQIDSQGRYHTVHIDIFSRGMSPQLQQEITALLDFYHYIGSVDKLNELLDSALVKYPTDITLLNRQQNKFTNPNIYTPPASKSQPPQTTPPTQPIANTNDNKPTPPPPAIKSPDPKPADPPLEKTNVTPIKEIPPEKETPLPPPTQSTSDDLSYTLVTREDRFPTRIPKNKQLITPEKQPPPEEKPVEKPIEKPIETPPVEKPVIPEPEVVKPTPPEVLPEPTIPKEIIYQRISDLSDLSEVEQLILSYYNLASADSMLVTYLIGVSANSVGDYENAIYYLKQIPETDVHYDDAIRLLYDSYKNMGDEANAALYSSLLKEETKTTFNIYDIPIKLWMILCLAVFTLVLGIITGSIFHTLRKSKKEELVSVDDFEVHSQNIQKAYETKEIFTEEPPQKSDNPVDLYENPPIITEELNEAEEIELIAEEQKALSEAPPEVIEETPPPPLPPEEPEEYLDPYSDEEYRKKMILKLHNDGWALEEIAKELQISQREIQLIIKMNA